MVFSAQNRSSIVRKLLVSACFVASSLLHDSSYYSALVSSTRAPEKTDSKSSVNYEIDDDLVRRRLRASRAGSYNATYPNIAHFFNHIPKTAGYYAVQILLQMIFLHEPKARFRLCNLGEGAITKRPAEFRRKKCTMYMSEKPYLPSAQNSYTIIRNPRHHVLSQYFHCAESGEGRARRKKRGLPAMPLLEDWLGFWVDTLNNNETMGRSQIGCYNPTSMQSRFVDYNPQNKSRLQQQYAVVGPLDEVDKTLCVVFIHYTGRVPGCCVCEASENRGHAMDVNASSHGVKHHGSSYESTGYQDLLIEKLVEKDLLLYEHVKALFHRQVEILEQELNVTLCERIRRDEKWTFAV